jgi:hypothetical protein
VEPPAAGQDTAFAEMSASSFPFNSHVRPHMEGRECQGQDESRRFPVCSKYSCDIVAEDSCLAGVMRNAPPCTIDSTGHASWRS